MTGFVVKFIKAEFDGGPGILSESLWLGLFAWFQVPPRAMVAEVKLHTCSPRVRGNYGSVYGIKL